MNTIFELDSRVGGYLKRNVGENIEEVAVNSINRPFIKWKGDRFQHTSVLLGKASVFNVKKFTINV